jgi:PucR C-terminal helix-turn-helix domain
MSWAREFGDLSCAEGTNVADAALPASPPTRGVELEIDDRVLQALRDELPSVAMQTVAAITVEVPSYTGALSGSMGANITAAVQMALAGFLKLAARSGASDPSTPLDATREGAYALGRGEARSGRSVDALLAAYRVGARVAWRELAQTAARTGLGAETMAEFAELVFAYIDELSAASVAGHTDELSTSGRVRERYIARLGQDLLAGARPDVLTAAAERAGWTPPRTLTAVLLPAAQVRGAVSTLNPDTLQVGEDLPGLPGVPGRDAGDERALLLVPDMEGAGRGHLLRVLQGRSAIVGPARPWTQARSSYLRTVRALELTGARTTGTAPVVPVHPVKPIDTEEHLADLVLSADPEALADLREAVLAPLATLRPGTAQRLAETLHAWLLHQGRRDAVAEHLHVHAQTVRYRMGQLRELYGDRLDDPRTVLELVLALQPGGLGADVSPLT